MDVESYVSADFCKKVDDYSDSYINFCKKVDDFSDSYIDFCKKMEDFSARTRDAFLWRYQRFLDTLNPYVVQRWILTIVAALIFIFKACYGRFYCISYYISMTLVEAFFLFIALKVDPDIEAAVEGGSLPICSSDEFKPLIRQLPEFPFWQLATTCVCAGLLLILVPFPALPGLQYSLFVAWFCRLYLLTKKQINHMNKYKYSPFNFWEKKKEGDKSLAHG